MNGRALALALALLAPSAALADQQELYTLTGLEAQIGSFQEPIAGSASATLFSPALNLSVLYGLSNTLHVGGAFRATRATDLRVDHANVFLPDHSPSTGSVYFDHTAIALGAVLRYRFDTGRAIAPALELEGGFAFHDYANVAHIPTGTGFALGYPSVSERRLYVRLTAGAEYRFGDHLVAAAAAGVSLEPGGLAPWAVVLPLTVGWIW